MHAYRPKSAPLHAALGETHFPHQALHVLYQPVRLQFKRRSVLSSDVKRHNASSAHPSADEDSALPRPRSG